MQTLEYLRNPTKRKIDDIISLPPQKKRISDDVLRERITIVPHITILDYHANDSYGIAAYRYSCGIIHREESCRCCGLIHVGVL